jgi:FHA domain-containing protein
VPTCPDGHPTAATDYCDVCGVALGTATESAPAAQLPALCPACGASISGRFCEVCGHDSVLPPPETIATLPGGPAAPPEPSHPAIGSADPGPEVAAAPLVWVAIVDADRDFFERMLSRNGPDAERVEFPGYYPQRRIPLRGSNFLIGKHSVSQGVQPDIDLGIAPADIGVSRSHARLHIDEDGLTITDLGSTNGTSLNGSDDLIPPRVPVPLRSGDRVHVGGWTTITVTAEPA